MFIELHILQNFAPSNLNRDDTGAPKDCEFGGYRRARVSSQCLKRAMRTCFKDEALVPREHLAARTKRVVELELIPRLVGRGRDATEARGVVETALASVNIVPAGRAAQESASESDEPTENAGLSEYLLYLGDAEIEAVAELCDTRWETLSQAAPAVLQALATGSGRARKKAAQTKAPKDIGTRIKTLLDGGRAADLALFGRMLADLPDKNRDAACQVAHAISTNQVSMEMDFYTAVDDLKPDDTSGADMLGTVEFNSACFYRYANVDLAQLKDNLGGDDELARQTLQAFLRAAVLAVPSGKQNSMAAQNPPSFVLAVARKSGLWNLANAFVRPIWPPRDGGDLVVSSIKRLDGYWGQLTRMYGTSSLAGQWACTLEDGTLASLEAARVQGGLDELISGVLGVATFDRAQVNGRP